MRALHYKLLVCSQASFRSTRDTLPQLAYEAGMERGFLLDKESNQNRVVGRYVYTRTGKAVALDPETLQPVEQETKSLAECRFELDQQKGLVMAEQRRGELNALFEALDAIPDVNVEFEELNLNLPQVLAEVQSVYKKNEVRTLRIKEYLARENMIATASFKLVDRQGAEKIVDQYSDQLEGFTLKLKLPDGSCDLTVTRKGTVRVSDDAPEDLLFLVKGLLPQFHEAEVETTQVVDPVAARRVRK